MPNPSAASLIKSSLSNCLGRDSEFIDKALKKLITQLNGESFEDFHEICENRGGYNLGSLTCQAAGGWSSRNYGLFRALIMKGYDPDKADKAGRFPSFEALKVDRIWMDVEDMRWAFSNKLDPLAFYPDDANGTSLLSVDFVEGRTGEIIDYLTQELTDRLLLLDASARHETLGMLCSTALPCYGVMLSRIEAGLLERFTLTASTSSASAPRL